MKRLLLSHPVAFACLVFLSALAVTCALAPWLTPVDPLAMSPLERLQGPSAEHWFGTDAYGRDVFVRTLYGARVSLLVGIAVTVVAALIGTVIGLVSGYLSFADQILMRIMDGVMSIPGVVLAVALMALFDASIATVVVAIAIPEIPRVARLVRTSVKSIREQEYIQAALVSGSGLLRVLFRHVLPNAAGPLAVQATFVCASAILLESYLSFLGVGLPQDIPSWGSIMSAGRTTIQIAFWSILYPGLALALTIVSVNIIGDAVRDMVAGK